MKLSLTPFIWGNSRTPVESQSRQRDSWWGDMRFTVSVVVDEVLWEHLVDYEKINSFNSALL